MRLASRLSMATAAMLPAFGAGGIVASASSAPAPQERGAVVTNAKVVDCHGDSAEVQPRTFVYACGDGGIVAIRLHWTDWGARRAHATGELAINDCTPNCASGHDHDFAANITLTRLRTFADGRSRYRYVTIYSKTAGLPFGALRSTLPG